MTMVTVAASANIMGSRVRRSCKQIDKGSLGLKHKTMTRAKIYQQENASDFGQDGVAPRSATFCTTLCTTSFGNWLQNIAFGCRVDYCVATGCGILRYNESNF